MKKFLIVLLLTWTALASAQQLESFPGSKLAESDWADGDSFPVRLPDGKEIVLRLYYVDCNETSANTVPVTPGTNNFYRVIFSNQ